MKRFRTLFLIALATASTAAGKPNFIVILTDDQGYGDVSAYRESDTRTPNIDRIGREGMLFTAMRSNCTVCSPTRAALKSADSCATAWIGRMVANRISVAVSICGRRWLFTVANAPLIRITTRAR